MKNNESVLVKAIQNLFSNDPSLFGIAKGKPEIDNTNCMPHQYEWINDLFRLKLNEDLGDSPFYESITSAFYDIHSYKFIEDPKFTESFTLRLRSIGVPTEDIKKAISKIKDVVNEVKNNERSAGWNKELTEIKKTSQEFNRDLKREEAASGGGPYPPSK